MADRAEIVKLAPNVPVAIKVKYADVVEGQYGQQIRLKGESDTGGAIAVYVPVDLSGELIAAGATFGENDKGAFYTIPRGKEWMVVEKVQGAGEKHGHVTLTLKGANASLPANTKGSSTPAPTPTGNQQGDRDGQIVRLYDDSLKHVGEICRRMNAGSDPAFVFTATDVKEMAACLFIARTKNL